MRRIDWLAGIFALLGGAGAAALGACSSGTDDCSKYPQDGCPGWSSSTTGTTTSSTGTGGQPPVKCDGPPSTTNNIDECAVYVMAGAPDTGTGTMAAPYGTLQKAIDDAGKKKVYACNAGTFTEAVTMSAGVEVYGGFDCTTTPKAWALPAAMLTATNMSKLTGPADQVALTIAMGANGALVSGFSITAQSPSDLTKGGSSIAVIVDQVTATLESCDVTASDAADGIQGVGPSGTAQVGMPAPQPMAATENACVLPGAVTGGAPGSTMCGTTDTSGGPGGKGGITGTMGGVGQPGSAGSNPAMSPPAGMDGLGGTGQATSGGMCKTGDPGAPGSNGLPGSGGSNKLDALSITGIATADDTDGFPGKPAQGGGGGGGAMSGTFCGSAASPIDGPGASGGGAGAGGCGGLGGGGGKAGGSSIAIMSLGTKLTLTGVAVTTGKGGKGGNGTLGQGGATGGMGAAGGVASGISGSNAGCPGGIGGTGGSGGPGGGGRGGYSVGVAFAQTPTTPPSFKAPPGGAPGGGGMAGTGAPAASNGAAGLPGSYCDFSKSPVACM